ncbi:hypothetical protein FKM82_000226, partial [Ascaphus truei]
SNKKTTITLGAHSIRGKEQEKQHFKVLKSIPHERYNKKTFANDIQLLKLSGKAELGKAVRILPLPKDYNDIKEGAVCETAGWGRTTNGKIEGSDKLMQVNVTIIDRKTCKDKWKPTYNITEDMMCTGDKKGGKDTCKGDSGGPLICKGVFRGITSFGKRKCGLPGDASVYTRLTKKYVAWIKQKITSGS